MFGLENTKKNKKEEFAFDIEKELKDPVKRKAYLERIQSRIHKLKEILGKGLEQEDLNRLAILLHGYSSLFKVLSRKPKVKFE